MISPIGGLALREAVPSYTAAKRRECRQCAMIADADTRVQVLGNPAPWGFAIARIIVVPDISRQAP
jgi:hypothetical protein